MGRPAIELGPCRLRPFRPDDADSIARQADDRAVWLNLRDHFPHPYKVDDARGWIARVAASSPEADLAIEVDGRAVGAIGHAPGAGIFRRSAEVGFWLGRDYWGRGIASAAVWALTADLLGRPDFERLQATVFAWNPASARVLEKSGYVFEGRLRSAITKDGRTTDALIYGIVR